jgi:hypothetical protein
MNPLISAPLTVALMIAMPCPDPPSRALLNPESSEDIDLQDSQPPPYLEFGVADVEVLKENSEYGH